MQQDVELNKLLLGLDYQAYHDLPGVRSSSLKHALMSPAHYKASLEEKGEETDSRKNGKMIHSMLENGERFIEQLTIEPIFTGKTKDGKDSTRSAEAKMKRDEWYAELAPGVIVAKPDEYDMLVGIAKSVAGHRTVRKILEGSTRESSLVVRCPETGLILKIRPDLLDRFSHLVDFKSSGLTLHDSNISTWLYSDKSWFYTFQISFYVYCLEIAGISKETIASVVFIETKKPWGIKIKTLDPGQLDVGHLRMRECLRKIAESEASGKWANYSEAAEPAPPVPAYVRPPEEEGEYT